MLTSAHGARIWAIGLIAVGVLAAASIFLITEDALWSVVTLLLTVAAVRRMLQHR